jgi:putative transposase
LERKTTKMAKRGHSEDEILLALRGAELGTRRVEVYRKHGISQKSFYRCKKEYLGLGLSELRQLRQLRDKNGELKRLSAGLSGDRRILQEIVAKKLGVSSAAGAGGVGRRGPSTGRPALPTGQVSDVLKKSIQETRLKQRRRSPETESPGNRGYGRAACCPSRADSSTDNIRERDYRYRYADVVTIGETDDRGF